VIDYLSVSLKRKMDEWKLEEKHFAGLSGRLHDWNGSRRSGFFQERLRAARDLASAFQYLHENRICFRDLKLENVGFDREGAIKLFDFGLSKELPALHHKDDLYNMTPNTGTLKYMAPEVAMGHPYNESCDVYSFAILLWEMLSLRRAFANYTNEELRDCVVRAPFKRPPRNQKWPEELRAIMHKAWSPRISDRPSAKDMELMLVDLCLDEHRIKKHSMVVHKSHNLHFHKPKFHIFEHKHSGHSHHHPRHLHSSDTDDCSSSIHGEPLSLSVH
jgi:serine/threonine protein kinase